MAVTALLWQASISQTFSYQRDLNMLNEFLSMLFEFLNMLFEFLGNAKTGNIDVK